VLFGSIVPLSRTSRTAVRIDQYAALLIVGVGLAGRLGARIRW
jgi:hypothetical protein